MAGITMDGNGTGRTKPDWLAFSRLDYRVTKIAFRRGVEIRDDVEGLV